MCLAQGHNAVMLVRLEPAALRSPVKHSTTEPLRLHMFWLENKKNKFQLCPTKSEGHMETGLQLRVSSNRLEEPGRFLAGPSEVVILTLSIS